MCSSTVPELVQGFKNSTGNIHIDKHDIPLYHEITMFDGYHLVMTFTVCHGFVPPIFKNGKPSISIRAIYTMAMLVITRWYIPLNPIKPSFSYGFPMVFLWDYHGIHHISMVQSQLQLRYADLHPGEEGPSGCKAR